MARVPKKTTTTPAPKKTTTTTTRAPVRTTTTTSPPVVTPVVTGNSPYRELGNTTRGAFKQAMSRSVTGSPPPYVAELDAMYDALAAKGVDRLAPSMSWMECKNSTWPACGVPVSARNPWSVTGQGDAGSTGRWAKYSSYAAAAKHWATLVTEGSPYRSARSIRDFINIYAPSFENDVEAYVRVIVEGVNALPLAGGAPPTPPRGDVLDLLFGGKPYAITASYGQLVTWSCPGCYDYFRAYGLDSAHHWAYDVSAQAGEGAPLYAPFAGIVVCAGTGIGTGAWGTGCAAFGRENNYGGAPSGAGAGRLELLHESGDRSLILGHALSSAVHPGDRVAQGQMVGKQGGMNASHVHVEGRYANGTRIGDPRVLFGGGPAPTAYAKRVPVSQPETFDYVTECVADEEIPVHQRADRSSPLVSPPIAAGEKFGVVYQVKAEDGELWWIGPGSGRVPKKGTRCEGWS